MGKTKKFKEKGPQSAASRSARGGVDSPSQAPESEAVLEGEVISTQDADVGEAAAIEGEIVLEPDADRDIELVDASEALEVIESDESDGETSAQEHLASIDPRSESKGLVRYDGVEAYLREIRAYPPLSREEEHDLAVRYLNDKDLQAAYRLVTSNLWLVVKIARDYERAARGLLDLVQEGNIGLMEAVRNYDPYRGVRFPSYAVWWIKAYIIRYLIANWRLVKIGTTQAQRKLFFNLKKEKERLEREGFTPAPKLLAEKLNVKESEVVEMEQRLGSSDMSVDAPLSTNHGGGGESEANLLSLLPAPGSNAEEALDQKRSRELIQNGLAEFAATLKDKERVIFEQRMLGEEKATLQEISEKVGVSRERVRQIENRLKEKLRDFLTEHLGNALESMEF